VSARHQVNGRIEIHQLKIGSAEETVFLRSVRGARVPQFLAPGLRACGLGSGPDVFADALVQAAGDRPGFFIAPTSLVSIRLPAAGVTLPALAPAAGRFIRPMWLTNTAARGLAAMVIVVPSATVNRIWRLRGNACGTGTSSIPLAAAGRARLQAVHRDT